MFRGTAIEVGEIESLKIKGHTLLWTCATGARTPIAAAGCRFRLRRIDLVGVEAELVVDFPLLLVAQNIVGFGDFLELLFGLLVAGIYIGVIFARKLAKGLADLIRRGRLLYSE